MANFRILLCVLSLLLPNIGQATSAREKSVMWKTDGAKLFDSEELRKSIILAKEKSKTTKTSNHIIASKIKEFLLAELSDEIKSDGVQPVHIETLLTTLGAITGFSCQMAGREVFIETGKAKEKDLFTIIKTKDGNKYYFGEFINTPLISAKPVSVWSMVGGTAQHFGAKSLPDINAILKHSSQTVGTSDFGILVVPSAHNSKELPINLLNKYWNPIRNLLSLHTESAMQWPFILGSATQEVMFTIYDKKQKTVNYLNGKQMALEVDNELSPQLAAKIFMEAAVPMSKIDPDTIYNAYLKRP